VGLDDRLRAAMRHGGEDHDEASEPDALRRRALVRVWRRRMSLGAAVLVVAVTVSVVVVQQGDSGRRHRAAVGKGLVQVPAKVELAVSSVRRAAPDPTDVKTLVSANSQFAFDLYHQLAKESPGKNLFFSPESISYALAMTYAGARGNTATEIGNALHFDALPGDQLHAAFNALAQALLAPRVSQDKGRAPLQLSTSNSAWGQRGFPFEQAYLDTLARYYGTGLRLSDFVRDAERERRRINAYVAQQTQQRITELIPPGIIDDMTRLVLVNTITFTADWRAAFAKELTTRQPFTRVDGSRVRAPMMAQEEPGGFEGYQGDHFVAARLPYEGGASMLLIVPDAGQLAAVEQRLDPALVQQITTGLAPGVGVSLPKVDFRAHVDLPTAFRALGVHDAFDPQRADLTGIAPRPAGLYVSDIVHEATIKVDEDGTKAAAATAVIIGDTSLRVSRFVVRADRPFIYLIRDDATGAILFVGRVLDPTQT
jgi:serpin B